MSIANLNAARHPWTILSGQAEGYDGIAAHTRFLFRFFDQPGLQILRIGRHFTLRDVFVGGAVVTKFAHSERAFLSRPDRRTKSPAGHGTRGVKITESSSRIERRTRLVISEVREVGFCAVAMPENAGFWVAGESRRKAPHKIAGPLPHSLCSRSIAERKFVKSSPQPRRIELADGKRPKAALCASRLACQPRSTLERRFSQSRVDNLYQLLVSRRKISAHGNGIAYGNKIARLSSPCSSAYQRIFVVISLLWARSRIGSTADKSYWRNTPGDNPPP